MVRVGCRLHIATRRSKQRGEMYVRSRATARRRDGDNDDNADPIDWMTAWQRQGSFSSPHSHIQKRNKDSSSSFGCAPLLSITSTEHPEEHSLSPAALPLDHSLSQEREMGTWYCSTQIAAPGAVDSTRHAAINWPGSVTHA